MAGAEAGWGWRGAGVGLAAAAVAGSALAASSYYGYGISRIAVAIAISGVARNIAPGIRRRAPALTLRLGAVADYEDRFHTSNGFALSVASLALANQRGPAQTGKRSAA